MDRFTRRVDYSRLNRDMEARKRRQVNAAETQVRLQRRLLNLERLVGNGSNGSLLDDVQDIVQGLTEDAASMTDFLESHCKISLTSARLTDSSPATAQQVFDTPELMEMILLNLDAFDLLQAQQVNRTMFESIASSEKLQVAMGLRGDSDSPFRSMFRRDWNTTNLLVCTRSDKHRYCRHTMSKLDDAEIEFTAQFELRSIDMPMLRLGKRCRQMLICQPPLKQVRPVMSCCGEDSPSYMFNVPGSRSITVPEPIKSETGITVGDILDATDRLADEHRLCPHAFMHDHDEEGHVQIFPAFKANIRLREGDPLLVEVRTEKAEDEKAKLKEDRFRAYIGAKLDAYNNDRPIPTLAEFEAANAT